MDELEFKRWFQRVVADSGEKIAGSAYVMSIFTKDYKRNPQCALELGIAIMLDKPLFIVADESTEIPQHLVKIASVIEKVRIGNTEDADRVRKSIADYLKKEDPKP